MRRISVASSNLKSVGYDAQTRTLEVEFHNGGVYQHDDAPQAIYDALMAAPSKGHFYDESIRAHYQGRRL